jgi:hypothetical protein
VDFNGGSNKAVNRERFGVYVHQVGDEWGVSATQQAVSRRGGVATNDDEVGAAKAKMLREIKTDMEAVCLGNQETTNGAGTAMQTRGAFCWLRKSLQTAAIAVPDKFLPGADTIANIAVTTGSATRAEGPVTFLTNYTQATYTEPVFLTQLTNIYTNYGEKKELDYYCGVTVASGIDQWMREQAVSSSQLVRSFNFDGTSHTISMWVSVYDCAYARVNVIVDQFVNMATTSTAGVATAGAIINPDLWEMQWLEELVSKDMPDGGGGEWGWCRGQFALLCRNPKGNGGVAAS